MRMKDLRDFYAIRAAEAAASMHDIQQALGHVSVLPTKRAVRPLFTGAFL